MQNENKTDLGVHPDFPESKVCYDYENRFYRTFPYPSENALEEFYSKEYREIRREKPDQAYVSFMRHRANAQKDFIIKHSSERIFEKTIDIGCGCGELLNALEAHAKSLAGYETDPMMAQYAEEHKSSESINITNKHFSALEEGGPADLITMSHVLEHIPHPEQFLMDLKKSSLKKGGVLFVEVPNDPVYWVEKQIEWQQRGLGHVNYFTLDSLCKMFKNIGFKVVSTKQCGRSLRGYIWLSKPDKKFLHKILARGWKQVFPEPKLPDYSIGRGLDRIYTQILVEYSKD